jgi:hypothetical protein
MDGMKALLSSFAFLMVIAGLPVLGNPSPTNLAGVYTWENPEGSATYDLRSDGGFVWKKQVNKLLEVAPGIQPTPFTAAFKGEGNWSLQDGKLTITGTSVLTSNASDNIRTNPISAIFTIESNGDLIVEKSEFPEELRERFIKQK